jgi:hypothetical protein
MHLKYQTFLSKQKDLAKKRSEEQARMQADMDGYKVCCGTQDQHTPNGQNHQLTCALTPAPTQPLLSSSEI